MVDVGCTDDERMDDRPWLCYKLTNESKGSGELKNMPGSGYSQKKVRVGR